MRHTTTLGGACHCEISSVREHGIDQFLHVFRAVKDRAGDELMWGDEVCS